jgi:hypothetical protein
MDRNHLQSSNICTKIPEKVSLLSYVIRGDTHGDRRNKVAVFSCFITKEPGAQSLPEFLEILLC